MARPDYQKRTALAVKLGDRRIGAIYRLAGERQLFVFEQDYIDDPGRATLSLSFKGRMGGLVSSVRPVTARVPPFFSNLLPEGNLRTYLAERAGVKPEREFFLLAALGEDLAGAVTVAPLADGEVAGAKVDVEVEENGGPMCFSLAGVQLKFSALIEASGGLTIPARGVGGSWIVKLPSMQFPAVSENEYVMLELARAIGIGVPAIKLIAVEEIRGLPREAVNLHGKALAVRRFDRTPGGRRIHMEDFAQVFGEFPNRKYEGHSYANIASVLWAEAGGDATYEFVRRLAFSVLIGNGDMHLKNWSLLYPDGSTPVLSPAYDFVSTTPYIPSDKLALTFGGSRSLEGITLEQARRFADSAGLPMKPVWDIVQDTAERTVAVWNTLACRDLLPENIHLAIARQIHAGVRGTQS